MAYAARALRPHEPSELETRTTKLESELKATDELACRWVSETHEGGSLHPLEAMRLMKDGAVLGGNIAPMADDVVAFDQAYASAPQRNQLMIDIWYKQGGSSGQKAKRLGIARATLYLEWKVSLSYMRGALRGMGIKV